MRFTSGDHLCKAELAALHRLRDFTTQAARSPLYRGNCRLGDSGVTVFNDERRSLPIHRGILRGPGIQSVDVAVAHAKDSGNQDRVVDFEISCSLLACSGYILRSHMLATDLYLTGNVEKGFQLGRDFRSLPVRLHLLNKRLVVP